MTNKVSKQVDKWFGNGAHIKLAYLMVFIALVLIISLIGLIARFAKKDNNDSNTYIFYEESTTMLTTLPWTRITTPFTSDDYFFYGLNHSSFTSVTGYDDRTYGPFNLSTNFNAFNHIFNRYEINVNGFVSLLKAPYEYTSISLKPFHSDIDMRRNGKIYYGEIKDEKMLRSIGYDVRQLCKYDAFLPTWAYVVTWFDCRPYYISSRNNYYGAESNHKNTFQLLLISNGNESFAIYNYVRLDWPNYEIYKSFSSGYDFFLYSVYTGSRYGQYSLENTLVRNLIERSNMDRPGRWFFKFNNTKCRFN